jgi:hypothetical protein
MLKQLRYVVTVAFVMSVTMASTATAQETLGFTINPTQGIPGDTVSGQVNPADVAAHCVTDLAEFQARFQAVFEGPFANGGAEGELFSRFFPTGEFVFDTCEQGAYSLTGFVVLGIAANINGAAETALPQTFVMTFADIATAARRGAGQLRSVTGVGSVVGPDGAPGPWAVAAACVGPVLDVDLLEAGIRANGAFLESLGFPTCDINSPEFAQFVEELFGPGTDLFAFLNAIGPDLLQPIVTPDALGVQLFTVLAQPQTKADCKKGGWENFPGLAFKNQGQCIKFVNTGKRPTTTTTTTPTTSTTTTTMGSPSGAFLDATNLLD